MLKYPGGAYLVVRDMREAELVMAYIEGTSRLLRKLRRALMPMRRLLLF